MRLFVLIINLKIIFPPTSFTKLTSVICSEIAVLFQHHCERGRVCCAALIGLDRVASDADDCRSSTTPSLAFVVPFKLLVICCLEHFCLFPITVWL